jgi:hypothetical protein
MLKKAEPIADDAEGPLCTRTGCRSQGLYPGHVFEALQTQAVRSCSLPLPTRIAFVGNYLPRQCGIATFTTDLCTALATEYGSGRLFAIPVNDPESSYEYPEQVRLELEQEDLVPTSGPRSFSISTATIWSASA